MDNNYKWKMAHDTKLNLCYGNIKKTCKVNLKFSTSVKQTVLFGQ